MSNQSQSSPFLVIRQGPRPNQTFPLNKSVLSIGRLADNDIVIDDPGVSRHHARLTWRENRWVLEDLNSSNGTFVNGQRITGPVALRSGVQVGLGPNVVLGMRGSVATPSRSAQKTASKKPVRWPIVAGAAGVGLIGLLLIAALAYFFLWPSGGWPFGVAVSEADDFSSLGPQVVIQQPQPGVQINTGDDILFSATAMDDGGVIRIDLYVDDQVVLSQSSPDENGVTPLSLNYPLVATAEGTYALTARAYNSQGLMGQSPVHHVNVIDTGETGETQELGQYVVQDGDTLESIAKRAGTTVDAILKVNPDIKDGKVTPGQVIIIPLPKAPPMAAAQPQPASGQAGGQAGGQSGGQAGGQQGGQQGVQKKNSPPPANPSPKITVKSAAVQPSPVYYGGNCTTQATVVNVTAKVEPRAEVSKVILAYAFVDKAGKKTQDFEQEMKLSGDEYKADVDIGKEAEAHLAQDGGKLDLRVEAYDKDNKGSYSKIYTVTVNFCPAAERLQGCTCRA